MVPEANAQINATARVVRRGMLNVPGRTLAVDGELGIVANIGDKWRETQVSKCQQCEDQLPGIVAVGEDGVQRSTWNLTEI